VTPEDFERAEELLRDPDGEDCERFSSRYGRELLTIARAPTLEGAMQALYDREINCGLESLPSSNGAPSAWRRAAVDADPRKAELLGAG
jgi:hypothetical protein